MANIGWREQATPRDVWNHTNIGIVNDQSTMIVPKYGVVLLRLNKPGQWRDGGSRK
ncbi:MAG TPA: hypothetical protein VND66_07930 [Acidobacteriaceae bacterium]|nr:hypothetical protein [Acidobacteriaceae bacterium]